MWERNYDSLFEWLEIDEARSRPFRTTRLRKLLEIFDSDEPGVMFYGGEDSYRAYLELRLAFIHGLYQATVILTLSCIEQEIAGALYARGSESPSRDNLDSLIKQACGLGEIDQTMAESIEKLKKVRNAYAHFRRPLDDTGSVKRTISRCIPLEELSETEALEALSLLASFINRHNSTHKSPGLSSNI